MKGVAVFLADGFEDMEALCTVDILRRGGVPVETVSVTSSLSVTSAHGVEVSADTAWPEFEGSLSEEGTSADDFMIFPGGMPGTRNLAAHKGLMALMQRHFDEGGSIAAICAAPGFVVSQLRGIDSLRYTCYDGCEGGLPSKGCTFSPDPVVSDRGIITGRGPGLAIPFALEILASVKGRTVSDEVKAGLML